MLELRRQLDWKGPLRRAVQHTPNRRTAIAFGGARAEGITGLESEAFLDGVDGGEIVVFNLAELEETIQRSAGVLGMILQSGGGGLVLQGDEMELGHTLFTGFRRLVDQQVNDDIAQGGF